MSRASVLPLPQEVLALISKFDSHPTADLIKELTFCAYQRTCVSAATLFVTIKPPAYFVPARVELKRRIAHNRTKASRGGVRLPIAPDPLWMLCFDPWRFETVPEVDLPDWVHEQYISTAGPV